MTDTPETTEQSEDAQQADAPAKEASPSPDAQAPDEAAAREEALNALDGVACVEAILLASDSPMPTSKIVQATAFKTASEVKDAVEELNIRYEHVGAAFTIETLAGGYQMMTRPEYNDVLRNMHRAKADSHLSQAALETLAIVAYRQPILRADAEAIRGVACGEGLRKLMDKQLVKIVGRAEVLGRPMLYGTTRKFLEVFGLKDLDDLPRVEELRQPIRGKEDPPAASPQDDEPQEEPQDESAGEAPQASGEGDQADATLDDTPKSDQAQGDNATEESAEQALSESDAPQDDPAQADDDDDDDGAPAPAAEEHVEEQPGDS